MSWIDSIISKSELVRPNTEEEYNLVKELVDAAYSSPSASKYDKGIVLAAFYDLAICSVYYTYTTNSGWMYCHNDGNPMLILPFVNCCPIHALKKEFVFHKSSKPTSAKIGEATSRILMLFFQYLFRKFGKEVDVYNACEPADVIMLDKTKKSAYFAEIKASPLLTMSLAARCDAMTEMDSDGNIVNIEHKSTSNPNLLGTELYIMLPVRDEKGKWVIRYYSLGKKSSNKDESFAYDGIWALLQKESFIEDFLSYWVESFRLYCEKDDEQNIFWFTNACGKPSSLSDKWEGGTTCISDAKTSVGMDRTDDIKKGIYQVLKLGSEGKQESSAWKYKVGIVSNIHPARHFQSYIKPIKDMVWTISEQKNITFVKDLPDELPIYNLFDGIITFTDSYVRDKWLSDDLFDFLK